jgi:hypothetical protein
MPGSGVAIALRRAQPGTGDVAGMFAGARAAADVARDLDAAIGRRSLKGIALEHAERALGAALATIETVERDGWAAITGATSSRGGWGRLGGDAVAVTGDPMDLVEHALA